MVQLCRYSIALSICAALLSFATAQGPTAKSPPAIVAGIPVNYDETLTGAYTLPDPLALANGKPVRDAKTWNEKRRPEVLHLFEDNQFGKSPGRPDGLMFDV